MAKLNELKRLFRFGGVGLAATAVHGLVYMAASSLTQLFSPLQANTLAFLVAVGVSYLGHSNWTFKDRSGSAPYQLPKWLLLSVLGYLLNSAGVYVLVEVYRQHYAAGLVPILLVTPLITYWLAGRAVFTRASKP